MKLYSMAEGGWSIGKTIGILVLIVIILFIVVPFVILIVGMVVVGGTMMAAAPGGIADAIAKSGK